MDTGLLNLMAAEGFQIQRYNAMGQRHDFLLSEAGVVAAVLRLF
jgi:hypothetical protein